MLLKRFLEKFIVDENNHWIWVAGKDRKGYGHFQINNKWVLAHRYAWEQLKGTITKETPCVLHKNTCHRRDCINPEHCYLGTKKDNVKDAIELGTFYFTEGRHELSKVCCVRGHEFNEENTYIYKSGYKKGHRKCKACAREWASVYRNKVKILEKEVVVVNN
jgi:hypothetical protein